MSHADHRHPKCPSCGYKLSEETADTFKRRILCGMYKKGLFKSQGIKSNAGQNVKIWGYDAVFESMQSDGLINKRVDKRLKNPEYYLTMKGIELFELTEEK